MLAIEARQQERLASFTVTTYETTVERIRARFEQGVRSSLDLRLAEASLAQEEARDLGLARGDQRGRVGAGVGEAAELSAALLRRVGDARRGGRGALLRGRAAGHI